MAGYGFKDRNVAEKLKAMAGKVPVSQRDGQSTSQQVNHPITPDELILISPKDGIPARVGDTMYSAICCVYDCAENYLTDTVDMSQSCNWRLCYNDFDYAIAPYTVFVARLRKYGHFVVDRILYVARTTTTPAPTGGGTLICQGSCKFVWSSSTQAWVKTLDTCAASTTTTTTSPYTSSTTTTTTTTCACEAGLEPSTVTTSTTTTTTTSLGQTTTTTTTTTTTSTTTTTTTTASCVCANPDFCGTVNGQCVYTNCIPSTFTNTPPYCSSTTTTSTSSTTTTSYNCATTTTAAGCSIGCGWTWVTSWVQTLNGCGLHCPCSPPSYQGSNCVSVSTACSQPTTTTAAPPPGGCTGVCCWWWHPTQGWQFVGVQDGSGCTGCWWNGPVPVGMSAAACRCPAPTILGNSCNDRTQTACSISNIYTSSTTTTTTTTVHPCYTSSTTTTTSTTDACTTSKCWFVVNPSPPPGWIWSSGGCPSSCPCPSPTIPPIDACQIVYTVCAPSTSTTTTTTTSTSTSTSTTCPAAGSCLYACKKAGWVAVCDCTPPDFCTQCYTDPCTSANLGDVVVCTCGSTTTTTSTTTSTSTTCSYCSWSCIYGGGWFMTYNGCPGGCGGCDPPAPIVCPPGGQGANTACGTSTSTSTSSTTTTSSTTSSTTTTCGGTCSWACNGAGNAWTKISDSCTGVPSGCTCTQPPLPCTPYGSGSTNCVDPYPTTTSSTTSTTTSSTTT